MKSDNKSKMTEAIRNVICSLTKPYGINFLELLGNKIKSTKKYMSIHDAERYSRLSRWTL